MVSGTENNDAGILHEQLLSHTFFTEKLVWISHSHKSQPTEYNIQYAKLIVILTTN